MEITAGSRVSSAATTASTESRPTRGDHAAVSPAAVSQLLAGLEHAGLVERLRVSDDRRRQTVVLTPAGRRTLRSVRATLRRGLLPLVNVLRGPEAEALAAALSRLAPAVGATPPPRRPRSPRAPRPHR